MLRLSWPKSPLSHAVAQYAVLGSGSICSYVMQAHLCKLSYNSQLSLFPFFFFCLWGSFCLLVCGLVWGFSFTVLKKPIAVAAESTSSVTRGIAIAHM